MPAQLSEHQGPSTPTRRTNSVGTISDVKLGHIVAALGRYRPVLLVVATIVLLAAVLEGPAIVGGTDRFAASNQTGLRTNNSASPTTTSTPPTTRPDSFAAPSPLGGARNTNSASTPRRTTSPAGTSDDDSSFAYSPPASSGGGGSTSGSRGFDDGDDAPLTIVKGAWATQAAGTPLGTTGVPEGSLPVGTRLGQDDKRSFIQLTGDDISLTLFPVEGDEGHRAPEEAVIQACQITESGWEEAEAMSFDEAPPYDAENCIDGVRNEDGSWTFSLLIFPQRTDGRGFALVPGADAPLDFQVAFARG